MINVMDCFMVYCGGNKCTESDHRILSLISMKINILFTVQSRIEKFSAHFSFTLMLIISKLHNLQ